MSYKSVALKSQKRRGTPPPSEDLRLLLHFDDTPGSTTFVDSGFYGLSVVGGNGGTTTATAPVFGPASFTPGAGSSGYARIQSPQMALGDGVFMVDLWVTFTQSQNVTIIDWRSTGNSGAMHLYSLGLNIEFRLPGGARIIGTAATLDVPIHVRFGRDASGTNRLWLGGVQQGTPSVNAYNVASEDVTIGRGSASLNFFGQLKGRIDELLIAAIDPGTDNFTPPTAPWS